jgi:hypothetical protein
MSGDRHKTCPLSLGVIHAYISIYYMLVFNFFVVTVYMNQSYTYRSGESIAPGGEGEEETSLVEDSTSDEVGL